MGFHRTLQKSQLRIDNEDGFGVKEWTGREKIWILATKISTL